MSEKQPLVGDKGTTYASAPPPYSSGAPPPQQVPYPATSATTTVITQQPVIVQQQVAFGEFPVQVTCPNGHQVTTNVMYKNGTLTFLLAAVLCFLLGPCCALIPFCINSVKDVEHTCPEDGTVLGVYKRI